MVGAAAGDIHHPKARTLVGALRARRSDRLPLESLPAGRFERIIVDPCDLLSVEQVGIHGRRFITAGHSGHLEFAAIDLGADNEFRKYYRHRDVPYPRS